MMSFVKHALHIAVVAATTAIVVVAAVSTNEMNPSSASSQQQTMMIRGRSSSNSNRNNNRGDRSVIDDETIVRLLLDHEDGEEEEEEAEYVGDCIDTVGNIAVRENIELPCKRIAGDRLCEESIVLDDGTGTAAATTVLLEELCPVACELCDIEETDAPTAFLLDDASLLQYVATVSGSDVGDITDADLLDAFFEENPSMAPTDSPTEVVTETPTVAPSHYPTYVPELVDLEQLFEGLDDDQMVDVLENLESIMSQAEIGGTVIVGGEGDA